MYSQIHKQLETKTVQGYSCKLLLQFKNTSFGQK